MRRKKISMANRSLMFTFDDHKNDIAMRNHAYKQGTMVYEAAGAKTVWETPPYPSTHNLGTNRMSAKAGEGVCNGFGQTHDIKNLFISDGSQFTTGAAENPTLTIVTLGHSTGRLHCRTDGLRKPYKNIYISIVAAHRK